MSNPTPATSSSPMLTPLIDPADLSGIDAAVDALDTLHARLSDGARGPAQAAGLVEVAALLTGLAAGHAPPVELDRTRTIWRALTRLARALEVAPC